jgi:hypothetical protein
VDNTVRHFCLHTLDQWLTSPVLRSRQKIHAIAAELAIKDRPIAFSQRFTAEKGFAMAVWQECRNDAVRRRSTLARYTGRPHGQSLVETMVAMLALAPISVGIMLIGQYIHMQQTTQSAAREAAWAATVDPALLSQHLPDANTLQGRLREHQFASVTQAIRSNAAVPSQYFDPMLTTFAGGTLLETGDLVLSNYSQTSSSSAIDAAIGGVGGVLDMFGLKNSLPPNRQGLVTAEVRATSQKILDGKGQPVSFLGTTATEQFVFSAKTVVLADTWDAGGAGEKTSGDAEQGTNINRTVRATITPLVPSTWLGKFTGAVNGAVKLLESIAILNQLMGLTSSASQFELGRTAPDVVPADKLVPYKNVR